MSGTHKLPRSLRLQDGEVTILCRVTMIGCYYEFVAECNDAHWPDPGGGVWRVVVDAGDTAYTYWEPA